MFSYIEFLNAYLFKENKFSWVNYNNIYSEY